MPIKFKQDMTTREKAQHALTECIYHGKPGISKIDEAVDLIIEAAVETALDAIKKALKEKINV